MPFDPDKYSAYLAKAAPTQPAGGGAPEFFGHIFRQAVPVIGGLLGGTAGMAIGGPPGAVIGAGLGGAGSEGLQRTVEYLSGARDPLKDTASQNAADLAKIATTQAAGEGGAQLTTKALQAAAPTAEKVGGALLSAANRVPQKYTEAALKDPTLFARAESPEGMSKAYQAFEKKSGLKGLAQQEWEAGSSLGAKDLENKVLETGRAIELGKPVSPQDLYTASQSANRLKQMAKFGEPTAANAAASANVAKGKQLVEKALEDIHPGYGNLRTANFESKAKQAFSSFVPLNKNMSPNKLALTASGAGAVHELERGSPLGAIASLGVTSPLAAQGIIRGASAVAPAARLATSLGTRHGLQNFVGGEEQPQTPEEMNLARLQAIAAQQRNK